MSMSSSFSATKLAAAINEKCLGLGGTFDTYFATPKHEASHFERCWPSEPLLRQYTGGSSVNGGNHTPESMVWSLGLGFRVAGSKINWCKMASIRSVASVNLHLTKGVSDPVEVCFLTGIYRYKLCSPAQT